MTEPSPGRAIRAYCLWCAGDSAHEVRLCPAEGCALWPWRFGQRPETRGLERRPDGQTASKAIHARCRDCHEFRKDCHTYECALYHVNANRFCGRAARSTGPFGRTAALARVIA